MIGRMVHIVITIPSVVLFIWSLCKVLGSGRVRATLLPVMVWLSPRERTKDLHRGVDNDHSSPQVVSDLDEPDQVISFDLMRSIKQ